MNRASRAVALAGVALLLLAGCASVPKTIKGFDDISREIKGVTVMPPSFTLEKVGAFSAEVQSDMTHDIECEIKTAAEALLARSSYRLAAMSFDDTTLARDPELRRLMFEQTQAHQVATKKLSETEGRTIDIDYSANLDYFADRTDAEHFLFLDGGGWFKTTGAVVKDAAIDAVSILLGGGPSGAPGAATSLRAYLVDVKRGKILWYNAVTIEKRDPRRPSHLQKSCRKLLQPLLGKIKMDYDGSRDDVIIDRGTGRRTWRTDRAPFG